MLVWNEFTQTYDYESDDGMDMGPTIPNPIDTTGLDDGPTIPNPTDTTGLDDGPTIPNPIDTTGLDQGDQIPNNPDNSNFFSNLKWKDISNLLSGTSSYGMAGQLAGLAGAGALLNKVMGGSGGGSTFQGYQGGIPTLSAYREQMPIPKTMQNAAGETVARRPGSGGVTYFSPMQYLKPGEAPAPVAGGIATAAPEPKMAAGGIASLGGYSDGGQLLRGPGDGVSDDIPASISGRQPARLADGEFVVPARIVSELGNGSTEAGARKLYAMMDRIKASRAKAKNIAADTKASKHLPA